MYFIKSCLPASIRLSVRPPRPELLQWFSRSQIQDNVNTGATGCCIRGLTSGWLIYEFFPKDDDNFSKFLFSIQPRLLKPSSLCYTHYSILSSPGSESGGGFHRCNHGDGSQTQTRGCRGQYPGVYIGSTLEIIKYTMWNVKRAERGNWDEKFMWSSTMSKNSYFLWSDSYRNIWRHAILLKGNKIETFIFLQCLALKKGRRTPVPFVSR